jgi:5'-methylthioadenosine phosphorylase
MDNAAKARDLVVRLSARLQGSRAPSPIDTGLDDAIITQPAARDPAMVEKLKAVAGRALSA